MCRAKAPSPIPHPYFLAFAAPKASTFFYLGRSKNPFSNIYNSLYRLRTEYLKNRMNIFTYILCQLCRYHDFEKRNVNI